MFSHEVEKALDSSPFIEGFQNKLRILRSIKDVLTSTNSETKAHEKTYSITVHELLINLVFGLKYITIEEMNAIGVYPFRVLLGIRFL